MKQPCDEPGRPMKDAPKDGQFLVWHVGEWRIVRRYVQTSGDFPPLGDDVVECVIAHRVWGARAWWPLPAPRRGSEGAL